MRSKKLANASEIQRAEFSSDTASSLEHSIPEISMERAFWIASERFKRTVLRGLDYLPPGEVSFADVGRAIIASDKASHPDSAKQREILMAEFVNRGMVASEGELEVRTNYDWPGLAKEDLNELVMSDWAAYRFAESNRKLLCIPHNVSFEVRRRLDVTKTYYHTGEKSTQLRELLFKVAWTESERCRVGHGFPSKRRVTFGTTLAIDWNRKIVRAVVTSENSDELAHARDGFVTRLMDRSEIAIGEAALGPGGKLLRGIVQGDIANGALRLRATARSLHVLGRH
jgi:hypothetical protein